MTPDRYFMEIALRLGRRNMGMTGPNPAVGCVITNATNGTPRIVGRGWTQAGGRPHAETEALRRAGSLAKGGSAYVTLEPCAHHGKTPPCAEALIEAGIVRVFAALEDPDDRVSGAGFATLKEAGIAVETGLGASEAAQDLAGYIMRQRHNRPYVILKLAISRDGKIAMRRDAPSAVTGEEARAQAHLLRARCDAIMVGSGTALADDPSLTCRLPGLASASPLRAVLDSNARLPAASVLAQTARDVPVLLFCGTHAADERVAALRECAVDVSPIETGPGGPDGLAAVLSKLAELGTGRLLVEGGARLAASLLDLNTVDEIVLFRAPHEMGEGAVDAVEGRDIGSVVASGGFVLSQTLQCGEDVMQRYVKAA